MSYTPNVLSNNNWGGPPPQTEEDQARINKLNTLCRIYEQTDRVLTGDPVQFIVVDDGPAPAWSDGQSIWINSDRIEELDLESLTQISGLNYHELAHHLYSPRRGTELVKWVHENNYMAALNILEDQRIETLLTGRYPAVVPYLTATVARWLTESEEELVSNYMAIRGRRYLPLEIRKLFKEAFAYPELIPAIADIVDQYRVLAFPSGYEKARELIERFEVEVLDKMDLDPPSGPNECTDRNSPSKGRPEPGKKQEEDASRGEKVGEADDDSDLEKLTKGRDQQSDKSNEDEKDDSSKPQDSSSGGPSADPKQFSQQDNDSKPAKPTFGSGHIPSTNQRPANTPPKAPDRAAADNIKQSLNNVIKEQLSRKDVVRDGRDKQKIIHGGNGKNTELVKRGKYPDHPVPTEVLMSTRKFSHELERLREACEPGWERESSSGRLNAQRVIRGADIDVVFDRWDEGNDGADLEAVILVDRSGSMTSGRNDVLASQACWSIKRAMEQAEAPVTVYAFDDRTEVVYQSTELANRTSYKYVNGNGGTDPYESLLAAERLFANSRHKNKVLVLITDGVFENDKNNEVIARLRNSGVLTSMVLIMDNDYVNRYKNDADQWASRNPNSPKEKNPYNLSHGVEVFSSVNTARDLIPFAKSVVTGAIMKRSGRM